MHLKKCPAIPFLFRFAAIGFDVVFTPSGSERPGRNITAAVQGCLVGIYMHTHMERVALLHCLPGRQHVVLPPCKPAGFPSINEVVIPPNMRRFHRGGEGEKGGEMGQGEGDLGTQVETHKTLVKVLAQDPWRHQVFYFGSQRVLFLNELKSHLPLSCSIHQTTSRESLT